MLHQRAVIVGMHIHKTWCENQVAAAVKLVPLGQTAGQRILGHLLASIPDAVEGGQDRDQDGRDDACVPGPKLIPDPQGELDFPRVLDTVEKITVLLCRGQTDATLFAAFATLPDDMQRLITRARPDADQEAAIRDILPDLLERLKTLQVLIGDGRAECRIAEELLGPAREEIERIREILAG